jgi:hypothetical protein
MWPIFRVKVNMRPARFESSLASVIVVWIGFNVFNESFKGIGEGVS